jgi:hypothetical protein
VTRRGITWTLECLFDDVDFYGDVAPVLLELLPETFFWDEITHLRDDKPVKYTAAAFKKLVTSTSRSWKLDAGTDDFPPVTFHAHRLGNGIGFRLALRNQAWSDAGDSLAGSLEALTKQFLGAFREDARFRNDSGVHPSFYPPFEYPHVDPEPEHPLYRFDLVVSILDPRMEEVLKKNDQPEIAAATKRVCTAPTPKSVRRVKDGAQTILFWTDDLTDEKALAKAASEHERWLDKAIAGRR